MEVFGFNKDMYSSRNVPQIKLPWQQATWQTFKEAPQATVQQIQKVIWNYLWSLSSVYFSQVKRTEFYLEFYNRTDSRAAPVSHHDFDLKSRCLPLPYFLLPHGSVR